MPKDPSAMRASDADRDRATDVLKAAVAEGRLRPEEYEDRLGAALGAQTYGELDRLVGDLPAAPATGQALAPAPATAPAGRQDPAAPRNGFNGLAVGAFVSSFAGFTGVGAIVAVILGPLAMRQIRTTGERGTGLAITAQVLGWIQIALFMLMIVSLAFAGGDPAPPVPPPPEPIFEP